MGSVWSALGLEGEKYDPREGLDSPDVAPRAFGEEERKELTEQFSDGSTVLCYGEEAYRLNRNACWNWCAVGNPAAIVVVRSANDAAATVRFARAKGYVPCVAGGRHSMKCMVQDSLVIDLGQLAEVHVDAERKLVRVQGGAKLGAMDAACAVHNLAVVAGHNPDTGVGGLTLAGGVGHLTRKYGLTVDWLVEAEVVLPSGEVVRATADNEYSDLMWGLKGGGGNFGIVTEFVFEAQKVPSEMLVLTHVLFAVPFIFSPPMESGKRIAHLIRDELSRDVAPMLIMPCGGPLVVMAVHTSEDHELARKELGAIQESASWSPVSSISSKNYHSGVQQIVGGPDHDPAMYYMRGTVLETMTDEILDELWAATREPGYKGSTVIVMYMEGALSSVAADATPFYNRDSKWWILSVAKFTSKDGVAVARQFNARLNEICSKHGKSKYAAEIENVAQENGGDGPDEANAALLHGPNTDRLAAVKAKYDPDNLFRHNRNIAPA